MQKNKQITVFINSEGYGAFVVKALTDAGYQIRIATNILEPANRLKIIGYLGQIEVIKIKIDCELDIKKALDGSFFAINCIESTNLKVKSLTKVYQILPILIAKTGINFVHFSSIISLNSTANNLANIQNIANTQIIKISSKIAILRLPTFIIGDSKAFENIGNIAKNINIIITSKFDPKQEIYILNAVDLEGIILKLISNNLSGIFDLFTQKIILNDFYLTIAKACGIPKNNIIKLPKFVFNILCFFVRFQRIIDIVSFEKTKLSLNKEIITNPLAFSKKTEDLTELIGQQFAQFSINSELVQNKLSDNKEYYPNS